MTHFEGWFNAMQAEVHRNAQAKGFWDEPVNVAEKLALIHSEISEALESYRRNNPPDDKLPQYKSATVELADAVIRIMDLAEGMGMDLAGAIMAKHKYNLSRPRKHGKEF